MNFAIGGVAVAALILGITEAMKEFGVTGKASRIVVFFLGVIFVAIAAANQESLIDPKIMQWINLGVIALAGGLAAMGYYDFTKSRPEVGAKPRTGPKADPRDELGIKLRPEVATQNNHAIKKQARRDQINADTNHRTHLS